MSKTALITGAANGIGYELAKILIQKSYDIILVDKDEKKLEEIKEKWYCEFSPYIRIMPIDLCCPESAQEIFQEVKKLNIDVDILINNAGFGTFGVFTETEWHREFEMIQLHIVTATLLSKLFLTEMVQRNKGKILNTSSLAAFLPGPLMAVYYASKAYLLSFTQSLANELKETNVTVTVLCPGLTKTNFQKTVGDDEAKLKLNWSTPEEVAEYAYSAMKRGKVVAIPGTINMLFARISRIIPGKIAANIIRHFMEVNRRKVKVSYKSQVVNPR